MDNGNDELKKQTEYFQKTPIEEILKTEQAPKLNELEKAIHYPSFSYYEHAKTFLSSFKILKTMKTGIELIAEERQEQINKHGWTPEHDAKHDNRELSTAAMYAIGVRMGDNQEGFEAFEEKICTKPYKQRLIIAGALIAAEIDRLNNLK